MPNVLLNTVCNLACPYCFAQEKLHGPSKAAVMPMEAVQTVIDFLKQSNYPTLRLMGGEPTLHPNFGEVIDLALANGLRIDLLSNATWSARISDHLGRISPQHLLLLLNVDHPDRYRPNVWERVDLNLAALAGRRGVSLSFNIFEREPQADYVLDLARRHRISRIRLSFSLPVIGTANTRLRLQDYPLLAGFIVDFARRARDQYVAVQLDNAVPLCMFSYAQTGELILRGVLDLQRNARCQPIIDIGPDLTLWNCFCLSGFKNRRLEEFRTLDEIRQYYDHELSPYQDQIFPMEECYDCDLQRTHACQGGCTTFSIESPVPPPQKSGESDNVGAALVRLSTRVTEMHYELPTPTISLRHEDTGAELEVSPTLARQLADLEGTRTLSQLAEELAAGNAAENDTVAAFERIVMRDSFYDLLVGLLRQGFLVSTVDGEG